VLRQLEAEHGPLLFHQSGGCCDGSSPMCYPANDFKVGQRDVHLGDVDGVPVYIGGQQYEAWRHTQLLIDVVPGRGETIVYSIGTLYGEWPDGTPFEGNRYVDRFVVRGGKIVQMDVWNDSAERLLTRNHIEA